jgi:hypothetical protein
MYCPFRYFLRDFKPIAKCLALQAFPSGILYELTNLAFCIPEKPASNR